MNIKSLSSQEYGPSRPLDSYFWDIFQPSFIYSQFDIPQVVSYKTIVVEEWHEMRIDLLFMDMYQLEPNAVFDYLSDIDVILAINNIDNPLNIRKGMILRYPSTDMERLRVKTGTESFERKENNIISKLVVPNKSTRKDSSREKFKESGYSLPPTILSKPKDPVRILDNNPNFSTISVGGL